MADPLGLDTIGVITGHDGNYSTAAQGLMDHVIEAQSMEEAVGKIAALKSQLRISVDEVHFFTHGDPGAHKQVFEGPGLRTGEIVDPYKERCSLRKLGQLMSKDAFVWLHGCRSGRSDGYLGLMAALTGRDVLGQRDKIRLFGYITTAKTAIDNYRKGTTPKGVNMVDAASAQAAAGLMVHIWPKGFGWLSQ
jgi:hypothetical protein